MTKLIGIDLSLTCTGLVIAPLDWGGDWGKVSARELHAAPLPKIAKGDQRLLLERDRMLRIADLAVRIGEACWAASGMVQGSPQCEVWIEQRAYSKGDNANGESTGDLHAILKFQLLRCGIPFFVVPSSEARKTLLGKVPCKGKDAKNAVQATFRTSGCPVAWGQDVTDAMCVLNHAMSHREGYFLGCW